MDANAVLSHLSDYRAAACSVQASNSAQEAKVKQLETEVRALLFLFAFYTVIFKLFNCKQKYVLTRFIVLCLCQ